MKSICAFLILVSLAFAADKSPRIEVASIAGCYALHYSNDDLKPSVQRSLEGFVRASPGGHGVWSPYVEIRELGDGKINFIFFRETKIDRISQIEERRNYVRMIPEGIEFIAYSGYSSMGTIDRSTHRIALAKTKDGDLTATVTCTREERGFWLLGGSKTETFVLKMSRLSEPCCAPQGAESFPVIQVEGPKRSSDGKEPNLK